MNIFTATVSIFLGGEKLDNADSNHELKTKNKKILSERHFSSPCIQREEKKYLPT